MTAPITSARVRELSAPIVTTLHNAAAETERLGDRLMLIMAADTIKALLRALEAQEAAAQYAADLAALEADGTKTTVQHYAKGRALALEAKDLRRAALVALVGEGA